jgi:hypothetical protein
MSWAARRRAAYGGSVMLFFAALIGIPLIYWYISIPETCVDGIRNQGETSPDRGGPCALLDEVTLDPSPILWARSFGVRDGSYNAVAYIQNSNENAGVRSVSYRFALYDSQNVIVAEREGSTFVMPGAITPVFESAIQTGNRKAARTYFTYLEAPQWERLTDRSSQIVINDKDLAQVGESMRLSATARNKTVRDMQNVRFIATIFDQAGNAFATSQTGIDTLSGGEKQDVFFTWPDVFDTPVGRIDIIPVIEPLAR